MLDAPTASDPARLGDDADALREDAEAEQDLQRLSAEPPTACLNCGARLPGRFCPDCGQRAQPLRTPLHRFIAQNVAELFGLDHRVWKTFGALVFKPGTLTRAYLSGRRETYLRPLRIYLTTTVLFFLLLSTLDPVGRARDTIFVDRDSNDSLTVAAMRSQVDSTLAAGFAWMDDDRAELDSVRARVDSLTAARDSIPPDDDDARIALQDHLDAEVEEVDERVEELREDSLEYVDRLRRERITRAVLAELPPDSVVVTDLIRGPANLAFRDSASIFDPDTDEWLLQSEAVQDISAAPTDAERSAALARFLRSAIGFVPSVMFVILPVFALILKVLYVRRDYHFSEHLVFGLHTHAFAFAAFTAMALVIWAGSETEAGSPVNVALKWTLFGLMASVPLYFFAAQKRVYAQGWVKTALKASVLAVTYNTVLVFGLLAVLAVAAYFG